MSSEKDLLACATLTWGDLGGIVFSPLTVSCKIHFGIGDLRCAGVEIVHRRSSRMVLEIGAPTTLTRRTLLRGLWVGSVTKPWAASLAIFTLIPTRLMVPPSWQAACGLWPSHTVLALRQGRRPVPGISRGWPACCNRAAPPPWTG